MYFYMVSKGLKLREEKVSVSDVGEKQFEFERFGKTRGSSCYRLSKYMSIPFRGDSGTGKHEIYVRNISI